LPTDSTTQIEKLRQAIAALEAQQDASGVDLSASIVPLKEVLAQLAGRSAVSNFGSGSVASHGGVSAGEGGIAVGHDVLGDVLLNSIKIIFTGAEQPEARDRLLQYLKYVRDDCAPLKLTAIDQSAARPGQRPLGLANVYVDLNLDLRIPSGDTLASYLSRTHDRSLEPDERDQVREMRRATVLEALACHSTLVLLGAPGSGKSTFVGYLALTLAQAALDNAASLLRLGNDWTFGALIPVRVVLRRFAASLSSDLDVGRAGHLWGFIDEELKRCGLDGKTGSLLRAIAAKSGAVFLLDGLDEAGDENRRTRVLEAATEFTRSAGEKCRFLITARPYAWENIAQRPKEMPFSYRLANFDPEQIRTFIQRWYEALGALGWLQAAEANEKSETLTKAVDRADLQPLAQNPLLLTLMATLHTNRGRLPDDRADLYDEVVRLLLQRWNEPLGADRSLLERLAIPALTLTHLRDVMEQVAYEAHATHIGKEGTADIPEHLLLDAFRPRLGGDWGKAAQVIDYIENRAGLLLGHGSREKVRLYAFPHRTFQEYLAGCYLARQPDFNTRAAKLAKDEPDHWRDALVLAARQAGHERGVAVADWLVHSRTPDEFNRIGAAADEGDWRSAIVAGEQLLELGTAILVGSDQSCAVRDRVAAWLVALIQGNALPARDRVRAGEILGQLGDPRFRADAWYLPDEPLLGFIEVPQGPFLMGTRKEDIPTLIEKSGGRKSWYEYETPRRSIELQGCYVARYPVTVAQFRSFVEHSGYEPKYRDCLLGSPNLPVVKLTRREALDYCAWLTTTLRDWDRTPEPLSGLVRKNGWRVSLQTDAEWEKAARGTDGLQFPWGNDPNPDRANYDETGINSASAVGCFPAGTSPYGCLDMAGNVWEWCQSNYKPYPFETEEGRESLEGFGTRVVRGGAFYVSRRFVRCVVRHFDLHPDRGSSGIGFRVVVSPASRF
jgi:formylglycine-generating enzyme required for sulfatase activity